MRYECVQHENQRGSKVIEKITRFSIDDALVDIVYLLACILVGMIVLFDAWDWLVNVLVKI